MSAATAPERPRRRSGRLRCAALPLALVALGCAAQTAAAIPAADAQKPAVSDLPAAAPQRAWALRLPSVERVVFRGGVSHDAAGIGTGSFLYPAPNAAGLLVAIIAHGFVSSGLRQKQKDQMQLEANRVLEPFEPVLSGFTHQQLMQAGLTRMSSQGGKRLLGAAEPAGADWLIESAPVYSMTQDQSALVLDNVLRIFAPGSATVTYAQTVRVVSAPIVVAVSMPPPDATMPPAAAASAAEPAASAAPAAAASAAAGADLVAPVVSVFVPMWLESRGQRLTEESAALFAESLDIALSDAAAALGDKNAPQKTFRYREGGVEKMERAQWAAERCGRTVIRTLRGWLMSIPVGAGAGDVDARCAVRAASS